MQFSMGSPILFHYLPLKQLLYIVLTERSWLQDGKSNAKTRRFKKKGLWQF